MTGVVWAVWISVGVAAVEEGARMYVVGGGAAIPQAAFCCTQKGYIHPDMLSRAFTGQPSSLQTRWIPGGIRMTQ